METMIQDLVEVQIDLVEGELLNKIKSMIAKGMTIAAIAAALSLPQDVVQAATAHIDISKRDQSDDALASVDIVARTIYAEASGETVEGKLAVASVIHTRAKGNVNKIVDVILKPRQFSCWNDGNIPEEGSGQAWLDSVLVAEQLLSGKFKPTVKATHYYNPKKASPSWARNQHVVAMIGNHKFLNIESVEV
jgi:spore germination cell wall hydrolase CwlJ-like protein